MKWSYGVTTCPARRKDLLPRTLASLKEGGFPTPRLFVDGVTDGRDWEVDFNLPITARYPAVNVHGNWVLSLYELFIREPTADRYAVFQDDFVTYRNLRSYLERSTVAYDRLNPESKRQYWNLYTFPSNQSLCPKHPERTTQDLIGWYPSNQFGRGAVALVFDREGVVTLLSSRHMAERPLDCTRGWRAVDGGIVTALLKEGYVEMVHNPSLVQHTGKFSSMGNHPHKEAISFKGEGFDALELLG